MRTALPSGTHWSQLGRAVIYSVRIVFGLKRWYRLVCWNNCQFLLQLKVMSHERYNSVALNTRR